MIKIVIEGEPSGAPALGISAETKNIVDVCKKDGRAIDGRNLSQAVSKVQGDGKNIRRRGQSLKGNLRRFEQNRVCRRQPLRCGKIHRQSPRLILTKSKS